MKKWHRTLVWLCRSPYSRGFGIQSPWAYRFVRYVINEHYPYYAYYDLRVKYPHCKAVDRKMAELYFRLANFAQAKVWLFACHSPLYYSDYVRAGSKNTEVQRCKAIGSGMLSNACQVLVLSALEDWEDNFQQFAVQATEEALVVVEHIHRNKCTRASWRAIQHHKSVGVTFDLYYCGIVCFDKKLYKQHYKINF